MKRYNKIINLVKISIKHKKLVIKTKLNKKEFPLIKILINLRILNFVKKINHNFYLLKFNIFSKIKITSLIKKKKMSLKKKKSKNIKNIFIVSNSNGISITNKKTINTGLLMLKVSF